MDSNTLLVIIIDGGLVLFFLYALYYISQLSKPNVPTILKKKEKEEPTAVKIKDFEPTYTPNIHDPEPDKIIEPLSDESTELDISPVATPDEIKVDLDERLRGINIIDIEGIGPIYEKRLNDYGISSISELLNKGSLPGGRKNISDETGISPSLVLEWVNLADLFRISGVGEEYSDLLEEAGVDTVPELARRTPANLHAKLVEVNLEKSLVRRLPTAADVERWVSEAKELPRKIEY